MRPLLLVAALVVLACAAFPASDAYVFGGSSASSTYLEGIRIQDASQTQFIIKPQLDGPDIDADYLTYPSGYCAANPLSLNTFSDGDDNFVLVWCDFYGVATIVEASQSPDMYVLPTSPNCNVSYCIPTADLDSRESQLSSCANILNSASYQSASAFEVLLSFPTSRPYAPIGQKSWFVVNDLSGAMSRFVGAYLNQPDYAPQFQLPDTSMYPASATEYVNEDIVHVACVHELAPIRFGVTPLVLPAVGAISAATVGPDVYSDWTGIYRTLFAPTDSQVGRTASPINDVLFPAAMSYLEKDAACNDLFEGTHAATARQVETFLQNHVSPVSSFFTFANSPSACLDVDGFNSYQHDFFDPTTFDFDNFIDDFSPLEHILRCLPVAFVVADYCNPLIPQSFYPTSLFSSFADDTSGYFPSSSSNTYQLPLLTEAQHALDWCMNDDSCVANNCAAGDSSTECENYVAKSTQTSSYASFASTYTKKYATHGVLACTTLPRTVVPIEQCTSQENYQNSNVCARDSGSTSSHAPTILTPELLSGNNAWVEGDQESIDLVYFDTDQNPQTATVDFPVFFRVLPMRGPQFAFLTFESSGDPVDVWITGCGYSDDCDSWTTLPAIENYAFPLFQSGVSSVTLPDTSGTDCGLFVAVTDNGSGVTVTATYAN